MSSVTVCACGCGRSLAGKRPNALYFSGACRARSARLRGKSLPPAPKAHRKRTRPRTRDRGVRVFFSSVEVAERVILATALAGALKGDVLALEGKAAIKRAVDRKRATT